MDRQLRTCLDLVIPDLTKHAQDAQNIQKNYHDQHAKDTITVVLLPGCQVLLKQFWGQCHTKLNLRTGDYGIDIWINY